MDRFPTIPVRGDRLLPRDRSEPSPVRAGVRGPIVETAIVACGMAVSTLVLTALGSLIGIVRGPASLIFAGLALLIGGKLVSLAAFGAGRRIQHQSAPDQLRVLMESVTLGSLLAFVASLALGRLVILPRTLVLLDWATTIGLLAGLGRAIARPGPRIAIERFRADPAVAALIRDQRVLLAADDHLGLPAIVKEVRAFGPDFLVVAGASPGAVPRLGPAVFPVAPDWKDATSARGFLAEHLPDLVIFAPGNDRSPADLAFRTRRLVVESLRAGVETIVLVLRDGERVANRLACRIVRVLSGLTTRSRLIRVRLGDDLEASEAAMQVLRIAARGRDGRIYSLGRSGVRMEDFSGEPVDAEALWKQLDRMEAQSEP